MRSASLTDSVKFVNSRNARQWFRSNLLSPLPLLCHQVPSNTHPLHRIPHSLGLRLNTFHAVDDQHRAVQHRDAASDLHREVYMPRGINEVDFVRCSIFLYGRRPVEGGACRLNRNAPLPFLNHVIRHSIAGVNSPWCRDRGRVGKHVLREGGLAGIDVREDADVSEEGDGRVGGGCGEAPDGDGEA